MAHPRTRSPGHSRVNTAGQSTDYLLVIPADVEENRKRIEEEVGNPQESWLWDTRPFVICSAHPILPRDSNGPELITRLARELKLQSADMTYGAIGYGTDINRTDVIHFSDDKVAQRVAEFLRGDAGVKVIENFSVSPDPNTRARQFADLHQQYLGAVAERG